MDDPLADLIAQHWSHDAGPRPGFGGTGTPPKYGQGTVVAWDPDTGANQIRYHGTVLANLPIISSTDILVIRPGDQVAIMSWAPNGGSGAYFIMGRLVVPGTEAAARSIEFLRGSLAQQISAEVFANRIHTATVADTESTTATSYGDLATVGPVVTGEVTETGQALVILSARMTVPVISSASQRAALMSAQITGATSVSPGDVDALSMHLSVIPTPDVAVSALPRMSLVSPVAGLNPGTHTFTAQYRSGFASTSVSFADRNITVITF